MNMLILLHTSKTMHSVPGVSTMPLFLKKTVELHRYLSSLETADLMSAMKLSPALAESVASDIAVWTTEPGRQTPAVRAFIGDIYSGLQAGSWSKADLDFAQDNLRILSGLYGLLRPLDGVMPYRLEMGYRLPDDRYGNLYTFWGDMIAAALPKTGPIVDLAAVEYDKTITKYVDTARIIRPRFLTVSGKTGKPEFVVVHAKIARGAFARWMITRRISEISLLRDFSEIGYVFDEQLSSEQEPVFVCKQFGGTGLSVRLQS